MSDAVRCLITKEYDRLVQAFGLYLYRTGLNTHLTAVEVVNEVTVEALSHSARMEAVDEPVAWLIGIGLNIMRRYQARLEKQRQREPLVHDLYPRLHMGEDELFDLLESLVNPDPAREFEIKAMAAYWLSQLAPDDRQIIELVIMHDLNGDAVARHLGISPGAARTRLHRALKRLRIVVQEAHYE